jgi:hypothetical protein
MRDLYPWIPNLDGSMLFIFLLLKTNKKFVKIGFSSVVEKRGFVPESRKISKGLLAVDNPNYLTSINLNLIKCINETSLLSLIYP